MPSAGLSARNALLVVAICGAAATLRGQQDNFALLPQRAIKAYQTKDYASFLALEKQILTLAPADPRVAYNVACGEALTGHAAESVHMLESLVNRGLDFGADKDADFNGIHQSGVWQEFTQQLAKLRAPIVGSSIDFTLPEKGLLATSVAVDTQSGDTYIASSRLRKIVKRARDGTTSDFATAKDGLLAVSYLLIDGVHKQLIASEAAVPFMREYRAEEAGKTGICIFDLTTGKLLRQVFLTAATGRHLLNALVVDQDGNLFVVDSGSHEIYRLRRASSELELFVSSVVFPAPQGLALSDDGRTMFVLDYIEGLWSMEVLSIDRRHIDAPPDAFMPGMLGLARTNDGFIAVQNGVRPGRVVRIRLDAKGERILALETLERNHPEYEAPAQGVMSSGDFLYIANSQLDLIDGKTGNFPDDKAKATTVLRLPIGK